MRKFFVLLCIIFIITGKNNGADASEQIPGELQNLYARSAVLMDGRSGRVLFGKNENEYMSMASTTKIMTCIVALEKGDLKDVITASENAVRQPKVHLGVETGQQFYLEDLLYSLMLESHNDSAVMIAEGLAGSVEEFCNWMDQEARKIGCSQTHFVSPNGLDSQDEEGEHGTTAEELARIMVYCISESPKKDEFLEITRKNRYEFSDVSGKREYICFNHNTFLQMMDGALSGKTGFTSKAGYCYVGALEDEGRRFVVALLACGWPYNRNYKWEDTKKLMNYALEHYHLESLKQDERNYYIPVDHGIGLGRDPLEDISVSVREQIEAENNITFLLADHEKIERTIEMEKTLSAPVKKGVVVGKTKYFLGRQLIKEYPIVTQEDVEMKTWEHYIKWSVKNFFFGKKFSLAKLL